MILGDQDILNARAAGWLVVSPFDRARLGPNSYDVRLAPALLRADEVVLDAARENRHVEVRIPSDGLVLQPGHLYLGVTLEYTETRNLVPYLDGKSSVGRLGLFVHVTAGRGDVGFCGHWTMELVAVRPVRVYAGMPIAQLTYHQVGAVTEDYLQRATSKYANVGAQEDPRPVPSAMWKNLPGLARPRYAPRTDGSDD